MDMCVPHDTLKNNFFFFKYLNNFCEKFSMLNSVHYHVNKSFFHSMIIFQPTIETDVRLVFEFTQNKLYTIKIRFLANVIYCFYGGSYKNSFLIEKNSIRISYPTNRVIVIVFVLALSFNALSSSIASDTTTLRVWQ